MSVAHALSGVPPSSPPSRTELGVRGAFRLLERVSESAATALATRLFLSPRRHARSAEELEVLARAETFEVSHEGMRLRGWSWGNGPIALLAHGWEGRGGQLHHLVDPLLQAGYRVLAFDQVGHGDSRGKQSSLPEFRSGIWAVALSVGLPDVIVAHSMGCVATTLALEEGLPVRRVVFIAPPADLREYADRAMDRLGASNSVRNAMRWKLEARFDFRMHRASVRNVATSMHVPLLVVHDRKDREVAFQDGEWIASAWPEAEFLATDGLGHRRILSDADTLRRAVEFLGPAESRSGTDGSHQPAF